MSRSRPVVAVVLAGGVGKRFGADRAKQLVRLGDRTVLEWSVGTFRESPDVDRVLVVTAALLVDEVTRLFEGTGVTVVQGGVLRTDSTRAAIQALGSGDCDVLFHDAARPLVDQRIVADCVAALQTAQAVTAAVQCTDSIGELDRSGTLRAVPDRERLRNIQTPQGFRLDTIRSAYQKMDADRAGDSGVTDDCSVVLRYLPEVAVLVVAGSERNLKITQPGDLAVAERLLSTGG